MDPVGLGMLLAIANVVVIGADMNMMEHARGIERAVRGKGGSTDWELMKIMDHLNEHPEDAARFTWWNNRFDQTSSPFD